jgi:pimeloyl-ACP methyl ester carboxylesterase/DNA-binding winged helix-turn-helix (wHTH) protein
MIYAFDACELDTERFELRREGRRVALEPQVLDVLSHLVRAGDRLVTKEELLDEVWGDRFVSESALTSRIRDARRAIGDDGRTQRMIRTVHGRGFRFVAEVRAGERPADPPRPAAPSEPSRASPQDVRFCRAPDGVRLAYATAGDGPPLVKAANWLTHLRADWESIVWSHWLRELSARFRLVHYDQRGVGMSDWDVELSFDRWVEDLGSVIDAVGLERFALLGISQGGAVATAYAARHPNRVSHLVLYGAFATGRSVRARTERERKQAEMMLDIVESGWAHDTSLFRRMFAAQFMPDATPAQWDAFEAHQRLTASPENARRVLAVSYNVDVTEIAPLVRTPTLVLHAVDDRRVPPEQGELLAALIPGAELHRLPSPNHLLLDGEPAWSEFLEAVNAFVRTR